MMGAYSTMDITREDAMAEILRHLATATDDEIARVLFDLVASGERVLHNFRVVAAYDPGDVWHQYGGEGFRLRGRDE